MARNIFFNLPMMLLLGLLAILWPTLPASAEAEGPPPPWAYDPGPNPNDSMGRELIDIASQIPNFPAISNAVMGFQKFRPIYGPIPWRMRQEPNSVKILFIGQDGTHIAEAAGRPATAGFGGRAQDLARYFGVYESAAFMNSFAFTIMGQAQSFTTPVFSQKSAEETSASFASFTDNNMWLMSYDQNSPITKWRNNLIDWILRNNRDSIKLVVLFGGAAREAAGAFLESHPGVRVGATRAAFATADSTQIPVTKMIPATPGSNDEFCTPLNAQGTDLYTELYGERQDYSNPEVQAAIEKRLNAEASQLLERFIFSHGGPYKNGLIHPAQLGGYDLVKKIEINGRSTISLKGLKLSDGTVIDHDVLVVQLPHPTVLSSMSKEAASKVVAKNLEPFAPYLADKWTIPADPGPGRVNHFEAKEDYEYARTDIGSIYYDFGAPGSRMVSKSDASRMRKKPHVIVIGTRNQAVFDMAAIDAMTKAMPAALPDANEMYTTRPRMPEHRYTFDPGPGERFARLMKENLHLDEIFATKPGKVWSEIVRNGARETEILKDGIDAYYVKSHPSVRDFGHYRGTFQKPRVLILADPIGADDLITARALTGARGQYLHGFLEDLGVGADYLVLKTVPFIMDGATTEEWEYIRAATTGYRDAVIHALLDSDTPELILTDGPVAAKEITRILAQNSEIPVVRIDRSEKLDSGILNAAKKINDLGLNFKNVKQTRQADIPRRHLSFYARNWEGTSGDRVIGSSDKYKGIAFAEVAPEWAWRQILPLDSEEKAAVDQLLDTLQEGGFPMPRESIPDYLQRVPRNGSLLVPSPAHSFYAAYLEYRKAG